MLVLPTKLRGDLLSVAEAGGNPRMLLRGKGVGYEQILARKPVELSQLGVIYEHLAQEMPPDFAVTCGRLVRSQYLGPLGYRLSNCATVGDLLADWSRLSIHIGYPLETAFEITESGWRMTFRPRYTLPPRAEDFCLVSTLAGLAPSVFNLSNHHIRFRRMGFPGPASLMTDTFSLDDADQVVFDCPNGFVEGGASDLELPIETADAGLLTLCDELFRRHAIAESECGPLSGRLSALFMEAGMVDLASASAAFGLSARSLQRRLSVEGSSYHIVLDDYRSEQALQLLRAGNRGKAIAHSLGFEDVGSFRRAFRRWTGVSTSEWRRLQ